MATPSSSWSCRTCIASVLVLIAHGALIGLLALAMQKRSAVDIAPSASELVLIENGTTREPQITMHEVDPLSTLVVIAPPAARSIDSESEPSTSQPPRPIDWRQSAELAARAVVRDGSLQDDRNLRSKEPATPPTQRPFGWNAEPPKAGFAGLLPYVRLGKRCVVGLGFFACAVGELPEANGKLFEEMEDADRNRSSVPDVTP